MDDAGSLLPLFVAIATPDHGAARALLTATPALATAPLARADECLLAERTVQIYQGDTALHAAAFTYDTDMVGQLLALGADIGATNRRGATPLHAAVTGVPGSVHWNPARQGAMIVALLAAGADPDATAAGGVTPLHRAVRNRCAAAVEVLLEVGADPRRPNDRGSTASDVARRTTGRGGTGTEAAKAEQDVIIALLARAWAPGGR